MIIFDENIEEFWINVARQHSINFISIRESFSGISDIEVVELAAKENALLITEDKDFGELVFSHGYKVSVMLLRYDKPKYIQIKYKFVGFLQEFSSPVPYKKFIVLTKNQTRVRKINED